MALTKTLSFDCTVTRSGEFGSASEKGVTTVHDAYIKVESVQGTKASAVANVSVTGASFSGAKSYEFAPSMTGSNFIAQAYDHLKTLPEFADAVEC